MQEEQAEITRKLISDVNEFPPDKKFYFNGFSVTIQPTDCTIVLLHNDQPTAFLYTSHVIAKTFAENLSKLIESFEKNTDQTILKLSDLIEKLTEKQSP